MIRQADIAIDAMGNPTAALALDHRSESPSVLEQDRLLSLSQRFVDLFDQDRRKERIFHDLLTPQLLDIDRQHFRHQLVAITGGQFHQAVFAGSGIKIRIDRGSGRAQQRFSPMHACQHQRRIPGMIARSRVLLLIGILMLLVYNNQA